MAAASELLFVGLEDLLELVTGERRQPRRQVGVYGRLRPMNDERGGVRGRNG